VSKQTIRSVLYPYRPDGSLWTEPEFRAANPRTYAYLESNRALLAARDKGAKQYEAWYAFGRRQGLARPPLSATSVYISSLCAPTLPSFERPTMLFYSGIRITPHDGDCSQIRTAIEKNRNQLASLCAKRSSNWITLTTTALRQAPVDPEEPQTE
jgi:hypothetical protein